MNWMNSSQPFDPLIYRVAMSDTYFARITIFNWIMRHLNFPCNDTAKQILNMKDLL